MALQVVWHQANYFDGDQNDPHWPKSPNGVKAAGYQQAKPAPEISFESAAAGNQCKLNSLKTEAWSVIVFATGVDYNKPTNGNPQRTLLQHEELHRAHFKTAIVDFDDTASKYFDGRWTCCDCVQAKLELVTTLYAFFVASSSIADAHQECSDYPAGADKTWWCGEGVHTAEVKRDMAYNAVHAKMFKMNLKCK